jgi:hypothetical protein
MLLFKKIYENNLYFYTTGALIGFLLFMFTFKSLTDFYTREFIESFSLMLFLSFTTVLALEIKDSFFKKNEAQEEPEIEEEIEEAQVTSFPVSQEIEQQDTEEKAIYEWDEVEQETEIKEEKETEAKAEVKPEIKPFEPPVEEEIPPEAAGFVPDSSNQDVPPVG